MTVSEKVSYLKGLAEGLGVDDTTKEGKVIGAIIDALNDIALTLGDIDEELNNVADVMTDLKESVNLLEDEVYGEYDDECCCDEDDFEDDMYEITCPKCGNSITVDFDVIQQGVIPCPNCGEALELDLSCLEDEECDCGCEH